MMQTIIIILYCLTTSYDQHTDPKVRRAAWCVWCHNRRHSLMPWTPYGAQACAHAMCGARVITDVSRTSALVLVVYVVRVVP